MFANLNGKITCFTKIKPINGAEYSVANLTIIAPQVGGAITICF